MSDLIVHSYSPLNAESPLARLRARFMTPQSDFFVRCHGNVPCLSEDDHRLRIDGLVGRGLDLSMRDLRNGFAVRTVPAVIQCAGNQRADLQRVRDVMGLPWAAGAIGHAEWTGVGLADVLRAAGADTDPARHVALEACDRVEGRCFGISIPMTKALCPDVLLAFAMNGETLTVEHGFPLRAVVPGFAGVRSPKWLARITVQHEPIDNPMQRSDYKLMPPDVRLEALDWSRGITINEMPLNAANRKPVPRCERAG